MAFKYAKNMAFWLVMAFLMPLSLQAQAPTVDLSITNPSCFSYTNGEALATVSGGVTPYTYQWSTGSTQVGGLSGIPAGNYSVTVTDANNQSTIKSFSLTQPNELVTDTMIAEVNGCSGTDALFRGRSVGGTAPFNYKWYIDAVSNATLLATTDTFRPNKKGLYFIEVVDSKGCGDVFGFAIDTSMSIRIKSADAICSGTAAKADVIVSGGTAPYTYLWNTGETTATINPTQSGTYTVTVTDATGCQKTASCTIIVAAPIGLNLVVNNACSGNGSATVTPTGGDAGNTYTYNWSNGATTQTVTGLTQGFYFVTVTDNRGCTRDTFVNISNGVTVNVTPSNAQCSSDANGFATANVTSGLGPFRYLWSNGQTTQTANNLAVGTYTVTVTDAAGCQGTATTTIGANTTVTASASANPTDCAASTGSATVNSTAGGTAPYTYLWSNGQTTQTISNLAAGTYTVTVTDASGCQAVVSATVNTSSTAITATSNVTNAKCSQANGAISLSASGGSAPYTYSFLGGANQTGNFTNLSAGKYQFSITDNLGCVRILDSIEVLNQGLIKANFTVSTVACSTNGDSLTLRFTDNSTPASASRSWSFSSGAIIGATTNNPIDVKFGSVTGSAKLVVASADGCLDSATLNFPVDVLKIVVTDTVFGCQGADLKVTANNLSTASTPTYAWTPANRIISGANTNNPTLSTTAVGLYKVYLTVTNASGCTYQDSVAVNVINQKPDTAQIIVSQNNCNNGLSIDIINPNANQGAYRINFGDPAAPSASAEGRDTVRYTYGSAGTYTITFIPKVACLDTIRRTVTVKSGNTLAVELGNDKSACNGTSPIVLAANANGGNGITYEWATNRNFTPILATTASFNGTTGATYAASTTYFVRATDNRGCVATDSVKLTNRTIAIMRDSVVAFCKGTSKAFRVTGRNAEDTLSFQWSPSTIVTAGATTNMPTVKADADTRVTGIITNQFGCTLNDTVPVSVRDLSILLNISAIKDSILLGQTSQLSVTQGTGFSYMWTGPNLNINTIFNPVARPDSSTTYRVQVTDAQGCVAEKSVRVIVTITDCVDPYVYIPNVITPNGDGENDIFYVRGETVTEAELVVYNRWGEEVYRTQTQGNIEAMGWDGTHKGNQVCNDVYGYYIRAVCGGGKTYFRKGNVTVMK